LNEEKRINQGQGLNYKDAVREIELDKKEILALKKKSD